MNTVPRTIKDLVIANRILANLGIVDAFGDIHDLDPHWQMFAQFEQSGDRKSVV